MSSRTPWFLCIALGLLLLGDSAANAESLDKPEDAKALEHLSRGNNLYRVRSFEEAVAEYKAGAIIQPAPIFDYNLGQCYRQLGQYADAIWHYERFVRTSTNTPKHNELARKFVAQMRAELEQKARTEPPTDAAPASAPASAPAGPPSEPATPVVVEAPAGWYSDAFGWGLAGAGLLGVSVSGVLFFDASSLRTDASNASTQGEANALYDRADTRALAATIIGIGAAGVLVTGIVKLAIHDRDREHASSASTTGWNIGISPRGVFAFGRF